MILRLTIVTLLLTACIDPINFTTPSQEDNTLVIIGFITDQEDQYKVTLTRSARYASITDEEGYNIPESEAIVKIIDNNEKEVVLTETKPKSGVYASPIGSYKGEVGMAYHVSIITTDGKTYESKPEVIKTSASIDTVYYGFKNIEHLNQYNDIIEEEGFQYYTEINFAEKDSYYMYDFEGTFKFPSCYVPDSYLVEKKSLVFDLLAASDFSKANGVHHTLNFMPPNNKYRFKYSYNLKQYALSKEAYTYFKSIKDRLDLSGSLFDPLPAKIVGNVYNTNDKEEVVLGYFGAYGEASKRIFISYPDLPVRIKDAINDFCHSNCYACSRYYGSTTIKPDFWE